MSPTAARLSALHRIAIACALLVLAITSLSAYIRLERIGLGCAPWPACYVQRAAMPAEAVAALDGEAVVAARMVHRVVTSAAALLVILLLVKTLAQQPALHVPGRLALALLGVALFLAVLGRMAGDSRAPPVILGNLLGGFLMFALSVRMVQATRAQAALAASARRLRPWVLAALVLLLLQAGLGGVVSAERVAHGCDASALCAAHRAAGIALAAALLALGLAAWRAGLRPGVTVAALVLLQAALGWALLSQATPLAFALAHNVLAVLLLAALLALLPPAMP
ncbi:MAG TPA: COX15/CtaA family protein [Ramlibacter sp.]|uniref:COX15/CtaA family protein n=1 Tax=Ramlibacter sp. TaxID=1917967 RepID=UPI002D80C73B|nr:COX15/CtaA family protein [Ramlibacter sp.]HET8745101.1 COX15/CtaA family protein [Ramlibacter sp.]